MIHITRQKRPDRVICKWGNCEVYLCEENVYINDHSDYKGSFVSVFPKSEIPNLIKALEEVNKK